MVGKDVEVMISAMVTTTIVVEDRATTTLHLTHGASYAARSTTSTSSFTVVSTVPSMARRSTTKVTGMAASYQADQN
jgi:hypothetical protein